MRPLLGLNLPIATHVVLLEPSFQPALEIQAIARVRRLNQSCTTYVHRFVMQGTVERPIYDLMQRTDDVTRAELYQLFAEYEAW